MAHGAINARLASAAELTRQNAIFADIGTDHAYLPLFLLEEGRIESAYCSDINEGPSPLPREMPRSAEGRIKCPSLSPTVQPSSVTRE